jgi:hypothetical protein
LSDNIYFQKVLNIVIENVIDGFRLSLMSTGLIAIENVIGEQIKNTCRILIDKSDLRPGILELGSVAVPLNTLLSVLATKVLSINFTPFAPILKSQKAFVKHCFLGLVMYQ